MRALLILLLCAGCATIPRPPEVKRATDDAYVEGLTLKFPKEGEGLCSVDLWVPGRSGENGQTGDLTWELWLDGHPFAAGVATPEATLTGAGNRRGTELDLGEGRTVWRRPVEVRRDGERHD